MKAVIFKMYFILIQYFFYFIFFSIKLYQLLDKTLILSNQGSKLDLYIKENNLTQVAYNQSNDRSKSLFFSIFKSPYDYKQFFNSLLVTLTISAINLAFTYKFLVSNTCFIKIYNKYIDIANILSNLYPFFKLLYYILFAFFAFCITYTFLNKINSKKDNSNDIIPITSIVIGNDEFDLNKIVKIDEKGLYQNVLITGSIGSGKTTSAIYTITKKLISLNYSGLILDVKGDFIETVRYISIMQNRLKDVIEISTKSEFNYNPLDKPKMSSIELAYMVRQVLELMSDTNLSDSFWYDKAESYIKSFIVIMRMYMETINFKEMHKLVTDNEYLTNVIQKIKTKLLNNMYSDDKIYECEAAINNILNEYLKLDSRTSGIIKAEITRVTDVFASDYNIFQKFCLNSSKLDLNSNKIYVLSINIAENRKLAKIISTYLKLDFQRQILSNKNDSPTFFICDEYQEFSNESDANFFALSRQYKCINIVSMQSYTSLINAIKNKEAAQVIIQNLINKIWLRNDDTYTVQEIIKQIGKEQKTRQTISLGEGGQSSRYSAISKNFKNSKSNLSKNYSITQNIENSLNENYFTQELATYQATCMLSDGNKVKLYKKVNLNNRNFKDSNIGGNL